MRAQRIMVAIRCRFLSMCQTVMTDAWWFRTVLRRICGISCAIERHVVISGFMGFARLCTDLTCAVVGKHMD